MTRLPSMRLSLLLTLTLLGCGAGGTQAVTISFAAKVNGTDFSCGTSYPSMGAPASAFTITDARFYVYDVELVDADGRGSPVTLEANAFQSARLGLLDFENGCGSDGTAATHTALTGTVASGSYTGLRFTLGVPPEQNFVNLTTAAPPLDVTGMFWIWQFGYKYFKLDGAAGSSSFFVHLGASGCPGDNFEAPPTSPCAYPNRVTYLLPGFKAGSNTVVADLGAILATVDLTKNMDGTAPGCMSEPQDAECFTVLPRMGVNGAAGQVLFSVK